MYDYACDEEQFLRLPAGISCHDTRNRVFHHRDPEQREACLTR